MNRRILVEYWMEKAGEDLASANDNYAAGRFLNAVRDAYFACFHSFSALLLREGKTFKKHKEVRSILHRDYIRTRKIEVSWGKLYDWLFDNREKADYRPLVQFEQEQVKEILEKSKEFVEEMRLLLNQ